VHSWRYPRRNYLLRAISYDIAILAEDRCFSRVDEKRTIIGEYQKTLDPHDFCPSADDICCILDTRKVVVGGADKEFNARAEEVTPGLPKLTSQFLEEHTAKLSALRPFNERLNNFLSLAIALFNCELCRPSLIHGTYALRHQCPVRRSWPFSKPIGEVTFINRVPYRGWCAETSKFTFSEVAPTAARGLSLTGEDPERITLADRLAPSEREGPIVHSWREMVSSTGL